MTDASPEAQRQRQIWSTRVHRELDKCRKPHALPKGAALRRAQISDSRGLCEGEFQCFVPFVEGSDALGLVPLTHLVVRMPFNSDRLEEGEAQYPFLAPEVEIKHGAIYLPHELRKRRLVGETPVFMLQLPLLQNWSPSTTLKMLVHEFFRLVQEGDPSPSVKTPTKNKEKTGQDTGVQRGKRPMRMRKRDVRGAVYPCQEVDPTTSTLKSTPMLLQSGNIALLMPSKEAKAAGVEDDGDSVFVGDLIPLKDVVRITPQRGKSLTLFFKDRSLPCRTFLSQYTDEIVKDLRVMIGETSTANSTGQDQTGSTSTTPGPSGAAGSAAQLLPFLSAEQTEKAKEMSTKFMGRLGKVATSVSRFLRGDEDEAMQQHQLQQRRRGASDPLAATFADIDMQKDAFFRTPSKARMTEITRRYQHIAEEYAYLNNQEGHVERAISELQKFIEHPKAQRILMETCVYEQSTKGIRVGPA